MKLVYTYEFPLPPNKSSKRFDLTSYDSAVESKRFRFVERASLFSEKIVTIKIYEHEKLPDSYTAISHIWYGNPEEEGGPTGATFEVGDKFKSSGPPINIEVLKYASLAAEKVKSTWIWLDRLCINTADDADHSWQMMQMHDIYKGSTLCAVFPNGLGRLTDLVEKTKWIDRGWTLQEAVAPSNVQVMFKWDLKLLNGLPIREKITKITYECAMAPLLLLLNCTISGELILDRKGWIRTPVSMFGTPPNANDKTDHRLVLPNVTTLAVILDKRPNEPKRLERLEQERKLEQQLSLEQQRLLEQQRQLERQRELEIYIYHHCLWKSTMMRSTRDPADMIFSIMGLFGGKLIPSDYNKSDCVRPAIELAQQILKSGGEATWLGVSCFSPPCPELSSFPSFPRVRGADEFPTVAIPGRGRVEASQLVLNEYPDIKHHELMIADTEMDKDGNLSFSGVSIAVREVADPNQGGSNEPNTQSSEKMIPLPAIDYNTTGARVVWYMPDKSGDSGTFAIILGAFRPYSHKHFEVIDSSLRGFIVAPVPGVMGANNTKMVLKSYFMLDSKTSTLQSIKGTWTRKKFRVGGYELIENYVKNELATFEATAQRTKPADSKPERNAELESDVELEPNGEDYLSDDYN